MDKNKDTEKKTTEEVPEWELKAIMRKGRMNSYHNSLKMKILGIINRIPNVDDNYRVGILTRLDTINKCQKMIEWLENNPQVKISEVSRKSLEIEQQEEAIKKIQQDMIIQMKQNGVDKETAMAVALMIQEDIHIEKMLKYLKKNPKEEMSALLDKAIEIATT